MSCVLGAGLSRASVAVESRAVHRVDRFESPARSQQTLRSQCRDLCHDHSMSDQAGPDESIHLWYRSDEVAVLIAGVRLQLMERQRHFGAQGYRYRMVVFTIAQA